LLKINLSFEQEQKLSAEIKEAISSRKVESFFGFVSAISTVMEQNDPTRFLKGYHGLTQSRWWNSQVFSNHWMVKQEDQSWIISSFVIDNFQVQSIITRLLLQRHQRWTLEILPWECQLR